MTPHIRSARPDDLHALHHVIERAYRGVTARQGWTHEADLLSDPRTDLVSLQQIVATENECLLIALDDAGAPLGSVHIADKGEGLAYLGLLCVDPALQAAGVGRRLVRAAEQEAVLRWQVRHMEMTVIEQRIELIGWYERQGYAATGEVRDFIVVTEPPLFLRVLRKALQPAE